jgi:hypothetical protein
VREKDGIEQCVSRSGSFFSEFVMDPPPTKPEDPEKKSHAGIPEADFVVSVSNLYNAMWFFFSFLRENSGFQMSTKLSSVGLTEYMNSIPRGNIVYYDFLLTP